ncbi:hypothetical protein BRCON_1683 [Candidatus Sumerlaea chitinivorans]|uniref:Uncharacterized protein n=1 Tax=Sumerlaea chitinivorans TaxID=2250252 RepID=A0A2Z4Y5M3_SUMC1|nr:hypothetical protein BRCON_1683 [Candidatus Sumerlaea chitinivorans]
MNFLLRCTNCGDLATFRANVYQEPWTATTSTGRHSSEGVSEPF